MIHLNERRDTPDWMPHPATCRTCGSNDWHSDCEGIVIPEHIELGTN